MAAIALKDLWDTIRRPKMVVSAVLVGLAVMLSAWVFAHSALSAIESETPPNPTLLWHNGAEGALLALAFGVVPLVLPLTPIVNANDGLQRDRQSGFLEMAMSSRMPRWTVALAKYVGTFLALAISIVVMGLGSVLLIQNIVSSTVEPGLVLAFIGSMLLLTLLYMTLALLLANILSPGIVLGLGILAWIAFNAITPSAFNIAGQFFLVVPIRGPQLFQAAWIHLATFTGVYQGLMTPFVTGSFEFIVRPDVTNWPALVGSWSVVFGSGPWLLTLLLLYIFLFNRMEL